ncbi:hypothetical protein [Fredinandcohnia onubensis]|uniref:hypothetical protein n=1 Tax=Fredinandcohnia onubensis TaxID=1571209 RepID=UPI000C0BCDD5|nr:hypothetical protein [Fredinandcohnia onubensis]
MQMKMMIEGENTLKQAVIYGQGDEEIYDLVNKLKLFVEESGWNLLGGIIDIPGQSDGLLEIIEKIDEIDIIVIYNKNNIVDDFNYKLLFQLEKLGKPQIKEYAP